MNDQNLFPGLMEGPSNRFAHSALAAVAGSPGQIYNPLWLYGPSGTGKTTLLRAALEQMERNLPQLRIRCIQAEEYIQKLVHAIQTDTQQEFHRWFSDLDVLAVDHLELLQGNSFTQMGLARTLAELANRGCQVILVSTEPPEMLEDLHQILRDRCEWFLLADIHMPTDEERLAMVRQTVLELELTLPEALIQRVVRDTRTHCHIRFVLNQLATRQKLLGPAAGPLAEILDTLLVRKVIV